MQCYRLTRLLPEEARHDCFRYYPSRLSTARQAEHDVSIPDQKRQGEAYCASRGYQLVVTASGRLCLHWKRINLSTVLAGQKLGIKESDDGHLARQLHAL